MEDYLLLVTPTNAGHAFAVDDPAGEQAHDWSSLYLAPMLGLPAVSVPAGFSRDGMPFGLMITGRAGADRRCCSWRPCLSAPPSITGSSRIWAGSALFRQQAVLQVGNDPVFQPVGAGRRFSSCQLADKADVAAVAGEFHRHGRAQVRGRRNRGTGQERVISSLQNQGRCPDRRQERGAAAARVIIRSTGKTMQGGGNGIIELLLRGVDGLQVYLQG
ncbi:MAG: amidase family protein [Thiolinea sp.]